MQWWTWSERPRPHCKTEAWSRSLLTGRPQVPLQHTGPAAASIAGKASLVTQSHQILTSLLQIPGPKQKPERAGSITDSRVIHSNEEAEKPILLTGLLQHLREPGCPLPRRMERVFPPRRRLGSAAVTRTRLPGAPAGHTSPPLHQEGGKPGSPMIQLPSVYNLRAKSICRKKQAQQTWLALKY